MEKEERSVDSDIILFDVTFPNQHIQEKLHITATRSFITSFAYVV